MQNDVVELVGPKGYIHGWIYVGGAGMPSVAGHYAKLNDVVKNPSKYSKNTVVKAQQQIADEKKAPASVKKAVKAAGALKDDAAYKHVAEVSGAKHRDTAKYYSVASALVNKALRNGEKPDSRAVSLHKNMPKMFNDASPTTKDITVHRGLPGSLLGSGNAVGTTVHDKGYTSTSSDAKQAGEFGGDKDSAVMHINVPAGSKVVKPGTASQYGESEKELVLNKGGSYKITKDEMVNGQRHVHATYQEAK